MQELKIRKTSNYDKFTFIESNRKLSTTNISKLLKLTEDRNRMHLFPIVVNKENEILDGQHRFTVCKQLSIPVFYIVDCDETENKESSIMNMNIAGKKHTIDDKVEILLKSGFQEIRPAYKLYLDYSFISLRTAVMLCSKEVCLNTSTLRKRLDEQTYISNNYNEADQMLSLIDLHFIATNKTKGSTSLTVQMMGLCIRSNIKVADLVKKLSGHMDQIESASVSHSNMKRLIEFIWNKKKRKRNRVGSRANDVIQPSIF